MNTFPKDSIFVRAVQVFGVAEQINQTKEECAELIVALSHDQRNNRIENISDKKEAVFSELADVAIMLEQMKYVYGIDGFERAYAAKVLRLEARINKEEAANQGKESTP